VAFVESRDYLWIDDEPILDDQVGNEGADEFTFVVYVVGFLLLATNSLLPEFDDDARS